MPKHLKAAAGPSRDPGGYDSDLDRELVSIPVITKVKNSVRIFSVLSDILKYRDPLHLLLDYMAEVSYYWPGLIFQVSAHNMLDLN